MNIKEFLKKPVEPISYVCGAILGVALANLCYGFFNDEPILPNLLPVFFALAFNVLTYLAYYVKPKEEKGR